MKSAVFIPEPRAFIQSHQMKALQGGTINIAGLDKALSFDRACPASQP